MASRRIDRRSFLKAAGVCIALPVMESLPRAARAGAAGGTPAPAPTRMVCVGNEFGMYPGAFWPEQAGAGYETPALLKPLESFRRDFTVFSHLDHGLKGGHYAIHTYLTGVKAVEARGMAEGGISLDQRAAEFVGSQARFPSLAVGSEDGLSGGCQMSWTRSGTRIPPIPGPRELFRLLFVDEDPDERRQAADRVALEGSILDVVLGDARALNRRLSKPDSRKLDEYLASVRDVETKLSLDKKWQDIPRPRTSVKEPENQGLTRDLPVIYDLIALALQTDSTRVATLEVGGTFTTADLGIPRGYHNLSHHGQRQDTIDLLVQVELYQVQQFARFLEKLRSISEPAGDGTLLDHTMVLFGSGMGNANSHTNTDLPIILAGGGFRHGEHKRFPHEPRHRVPLCNLYVSMLQRFGVETDHFGTSTGTLTGLERA
jgi:hypothetical protein